MCDWLCITWVKKFVCIKQTSFRRKSPTNEPCVISYWSFNEIRLRCRISSHESGNKMSLAEERTACWQSVCHVFVYVRLGGGERKRQGKRLTGESFWMRSWATCTKFLSSCMCFWKRRLSSSSRRSKSLAASSKAWMRPFQERSAGTWGATAELTPVPITRTSSGARLVFRLGSSFLCGRQRFSDCGTKDDSDSMKVKQTFFKHWHAATN